jgi:hypothetical protein
VHILALVCCIHYFIQSILDVLTRLVNHLGSVCVCVCARARAGAGACVRARACGRGVCAVCVRCVALRCLVLKLMTAPSGFHIPLNLSM